MAVNSERVDFVQAGGITGPVILGVLGVRRVPISELEDFRFDGVDAAWEEDIFASIAERWIRLYRFYLDVERAVLGRHRSGVKLS